MGGAIVRGMVANNIADPDSILLYDKKIDQARSLAEETGCLVGDLSRTVRGSGLLLIAVKPQDAEALFREIASDIVDQPVISVMAGVRTGTIAERLGKKVPIARVMPNMGAFAGAGVSGISYSEGFTRKKEIEEIFRGVGKVVEVSEKDMDAVTAVSGSGPAYLFYLAGAMIEAAEDEGLSEEQARTLVYQTLKGAAIVLEGSELSAGELVSRVASRGGTTEAALNVFSHEGMDRAIKKAVAAAKQRSKELAEGLGRR